MVFYSNKQAITFVLTSVVVISHVLGARHNPFLEETGSGYYLDDDTSLIFKRDPVKGNMWFGPRLGRRKRSDDENSLSDREKNNGGVVEFLQDSPWAFVALKGGKRRTLNFTPRLGRDSDEEYGENAVEGSYGKSSSRSGSHVGGTFVSSNNFTPRLGRYAPLLNHDRL